MKIEMPNKYSASECEAKWAKKWIDGNVYKFDNSERDNVFVIDTPPPTVSGDMHAGHAFSYAQQDFVARYHRMKGKNVYYPFGTDDNGLPTERLVEKLKKVDSNRMDRAEFVELCDKTIKEIQPAFVQDWVNLGMSCDFSSSYSTINKYCQKTSQASFLDLFSKGLVHRAETPISWCVKCQTAIAQAEFENIELDSHFNDVVFKVGNEDLVVSTTRPELIPACVGLFYHPDDVRYKVLKGKFAKVPLFDYEVPILSDGSVDPEKGTGLMMVCTFGDKDDVEKWHKYHLELRIVFEKEGRLNELGGKYKGMKIKDARKAILEDLKATGALLKQDQIKHNVNVHDKCGTEIEFLKTKQWYIKVLENKHDFLEAGNKIKWFPEYMKSRYVHWVENLNWDWCISRQRHFGIPFPVWYEKKTGKIVVADESELPVDPEKDVPEGYKKEDLIPEMDVMDTWATSSVSPQIVLDWKGESGYGVNFENYPCGLRPQAHDIIRTWAFYTIVKGLYHHGKIPWEEILISGHVLDENGKKLSKSKGNYIPPQEIFKKYGADSLRLWAATSKLGEDLRYREEDIKSAQKTVTKLWNASKFVYMHLEDYDCAGKEYDPERLELMDRWLLIKLNKVINNSTDGFDIYEYSKAKKEVENFFWSTFCDNYLEIVKDRLYNPKERGELSRLSGQYTLHSVLLDVLKIFAPIAPFITDEIYSYHFSESGNSIHLSDWPEADIAVEDEDIEKIGDRFVEVLGDVRKVKSEAGKSLKEEIDVVLKKEDFDLISKCMDDFKAATKAKSVSAGEEFSVSF